MSEKSQSSEIFTHYGRVRTSIGLFMTVVVVLGILLFGRFTLITWFTAFVAGGWGLLGVSLNYLFYGGTITLTDDAIIQQALHISPKKFFYKDIYHVSERGLTFFAPQDQMRIGRTLEDYERFYRLLRARIPVEAFNDHLNLPWKLRMRSVGFGNGTREIFLTDDQIIVCQRGQEHVWPVAQMESVYLDGGPRGRHQSFVIDGAYTFDAVIKMKEGARIIINESQLYSLRFTPEHFVANLHRLYPHTAPPDDDLPPEIEWLIEQGHSCFDNGNIAGAIKLYEQALSISRYQWIVWQQLGACHLQMGNYPDAANAFREAITLNIEDADSFYNGAVAYSRVGDVLKTRVYLQEALTLCPEMKKQAKTNPFLQNYLE